MFKSFLNKGTERLLAVCGAATSIVILFICIFLFSEGISLFQSPSVDKGYSLYMHADNPVDDLTALEIKNIFDSKIRNWKDVGGEDRLILLYSLDDVFKEYDQSELEDTEVLSQKLVDAISNNNDIIAFVPKRYMPISALGVKELPIRDIALSDFLLGKEWIPTASPAPLYGVLPLVLGTLLVSFAAIVIALPLGLGVAIYLAELANEKTRKLMKPLIELLAGIPSVVYGFFGLAVIVPFMQRVFNLAVGETALAGSIILAIMALPTIISVAEDAIRNTPKAMREASLALGASHWQTICRVVIPYARSGIAAALILGIGRAIGETMAVLMVTGNAAVMPTSLLQSVRTIPATVAAELGETPIGGSHYKALFLLGCILFLITLLISISAEMISRKHKNG